MYLFLQYINVPPLSKAPSVGAFRMVDSNYMKVKAPGQGHSQNKPPKMRH